MSTDQFPLRGGERGRGRARAREGLTGQSNRRRRGCRGRHVCGGGGRGEGASVGGVGQRGHIIKGWTGVSHGMDDKELHPEDDYSHRFFIWHEWIQAHGPLTTGNVFDYFATSMFYDKQSNNQVLRMQTMHTGTPILNESDELRSVPALLPLAGPSPFPGASPASSLPSPTRRPPPSSSSTSASVSPLTKVRLPSSP